MKFGKVYLVGAGPGDPCLITIKGIECLKKAEVIVYDHLLDVALLETAPSDAEKVYVGKITGKHTKPQNEINRILVDKAKEGKTVIRLKGGDPFVFGRGGEEAEALAKNSNTGYNFSSSRACLCRHSDYTPRTGFIIYRNNRA
jgi:uroporphyrinogen III methyltransferase/synthase